MKMISLLFSITVASEKKLLFIIFIDNYIGVSRLLDLDNKRAAKTKFELQTNILMLKF